MTTRIHIDAHAGWDVKYTVVSLESDGTETNREERVVPKNTSQDVYIHSTMKLDNIHEVKE